MKNVLITGSTGFLGSNIVKQLLKIKKNILYLLVRSKNDLSSAKRIQNVFSEKYIDLHKGRVVVVEGDITRKDVGLKPQDKKELISNIDTIFHSAAMCEFGVPLERIRKINVEGTRNILDLALECEKENSHISFNHISTVGVAGSSGGMFYEKDLDVKQEFNNTYEFTKFEAEKLINEYRKMGLSISIFRPTIITGDSKTGEVNNFKMLYQPLHIFSLELFNEIPANIEMKYNLVPVDYVANAICSISSKRDNCNMNYHLSNPSNITLEYFLEIASEYFGFKKPKIAYGNNYNYKKLNGFRRRLLEHYLPYFNHKKIYFDASNFNEAVNDEKFRWPKVDKNFLIKLFKYCTKTGYIKRKHN
ncbi:SDR family oxidoreductase [Candidatus Omnitrophota bacterium]